MNKLFSLKVKFDHQKVIDEDFNTIEDMDKVFKTIKKKFNGD